MPVCRGLMDIVARVRAMLDAMRRLDLAELDIKIHAERIYLRRSAPSGRDPEAPAARRNLRSAGHVVRSPIAGSYFATPRPGAEPYVQIGDDVVEGQVVGLIEAMKVFNEVTADRSGQVAGILVHSGDTVATGQALIVLDADIRPERDPV